MSRTHNNTLQEISTQLQEKETKLKKEGVQPQKQVPSRESSAPNTKKWPLQHSARPNKELSRPLLINSTSTKGFDPHTNKSPPPNKKLGCNKKNSTTVKKSQLQEDELYHN
jgi:hypothetical protein